MNTPAHPVRPLTDVPTLAAQAIDMLRSPGAMLGLTVDEARVVVGHMRAVSWSYAPTTS
jgi:hypothetical protein